MKEQQPPCSTLARRPNSSISCTMTDSTVREKLEIKGSQRGCQNQEDKREGSLETQYNEKKNLYTLMVKQFEKKQKVIKDHYKLLEELRKNIQNNCGKELEPLEPVVIVDIEPPFRVENDTTVSTKAVDKRSVITFETTIRNDMQIDFSEFYNTVDANLNQSREIWLQLIPVIMKSRRDLIKKIMELNPEEDVSDFIQDMGLELSIENAKYCSKVKLDELSAYLNKLYSNRETLKHELKVLLDSEKLSALIMRDYKEMVMRLKQVEEELTKEKIRTEDLMERRNLMEKKHQAGEKKIEELQQINAELQNELSQLNFQMKSLKQREFTNRRIGGIKQKELKDLKEKSDLLKAMENHITELTNEHNAHTRSTQRKIEELEQRVIEKEEALKTQSQITESLKISLQEAEEKIQHVREKKKVFADMVDQTKQILRGTSPTKREEQLWIELEATKIIVKGYQDQLSKATEERNKMLLKFQTISEDKSNENVERLAAELVRKEEIIHNLKNQVTELQTACEDHSMKYNKLLAQVKEVHEKMDGKLDAASLSKQLGNIKMQKKELQEVVKELVSHNEELETALVQRSLELDQRDRLVKQQCNLLKMRDELTDLVRSKDEAQFHGVRKIMEQNSVWEKKAEKIYKDLEKKANELDNMYKVLVEKQKQVVKLTKLVKTMEDQQTRAQEQRVRFESKIAELQRQLSEGTQRATKSQFFDHD
ncbi:UNVERIFIED_CONTAM: hypothetical protein PYX00_001837 [Menopon gallinae]